MYLLKHIGVFGLGVGMWFISMLATASPVNINKADAKTLAASISGVGPAKAQAIVEYRRKNGPFKSIHDLTKIKGIGESLISRNKSDLLLNDKLR